MWTIFITYNYNYNLFLKKNLIFYKLKTILKKEKFQFFSLRYTRVTSRDFLKTCQPIRSSKTCQPIRSSKTCQTIRSSKTIFQTFSYEMLIGTVDVISYDFPLICWHVSFTKVPFIPLTQATFRTRHGKPCRVNLSGPSLYCIARTLA